MAEVKNYDLVIVGAGMAGIIAAARIAEKGINPRTGDRLRIALIEAGPHIYTGKFRSGYGDPVHRRLAPQVLWEEFANVPKWPWPFGLKVVGGCSVHWGAHCHVPFDEDYENWCALGNDWTRENMKEAVEDVVEMFNLRADPEEAYTPGEKLFRETAQSMGYKVQPVLSPRKNCIYCGFHNEGHACKYDAKSNSVWYLPIALENGVELIHDAEVKKVIIEKAGAGGVVKGVVYQKNGETNEARAENVMVACGSWGTPVLLAKSGYGPKDELGAALIVENANVGHNLDGDTSSKVSVMFSQPIKEAGRGTNGSICFLVHDGNYKDGTGTLRISTAEMSYINYPHIMAMSEFAPAFGKAHTDFMRRVTTQHGAITVLFNRPPTHIKGRVDLKTGAHIYPGDPYIDKRMQEGKEITIELLKKMGAEKISNRFPATFKGRGGGHTNGTCRAGSDRANSVINQNFESHEVKGLFVVDASSYPRASINSGSFAAIMGAFGARRIVANHFSRGAS
ncbi:MAG: GMC family oxidoreductase [Acidobacteria bacterium]|nr:GMC family oxidoreductase [Acidobacteriota bacterium]